MNALEHAPEQARAALLPGARPAHDVQAAPGDIPARHWQGGPVDCSVCVHAPLRARQGVLGEEGGKKGCEPGYACMQDAYARRIDRFFRWHPELADAQLDHPYFEVRAIAARYASVFRLTALVDDPDETVRLQVALRLPLAQLKRLAADAHREVRIRVALRLPPAELAALRNDPDYGVRERVAQRLPVALLPGMAHDPERSVRMRVAQRLEMPALLRMAEDSAPEVRRIVAERLPDALLPRLAGDADWRVRWEVALRAPLAALAALAALRDDTDPEVRQMVRTRLQAQPRQRRAPALASHLVPHSASHSAPKEATAPGASSPAAALCAGADHG